MRVYHVYSNKLTYSLTNLLVTRRSCELTYVAYTRLANASSNCTFPTFRILCSQLSG